MANSDAGGGKKEAAGPVVPSCPRVDTSAPDFLPETFVPGFHDEAAVKKMRYRQVRSEL